MSIPGIKRGNVIYIWINALFTSNILRNQINQIFSDFIPTINIILIIAKEEKSGIFQNTTKESRPYSPMSLVFLIETAKKIGEMNS